MKATANTIISLFFSLTVAHGEDTPKSTNRTLYLQGVVNFIYFRENTVVFFSGALRAGDLGKGLGESGAKGRVENWRGPIGIRGWRIPIIQNGIEQWTTESIYGNRLITSEIVAELDDFIVLRSPNDEVIGVSGRTLTVKTLKKLKQPWEK